MKNNKNEFKLGDKVKALVNGYYLQGEIVDIKGETATVVVPVYYSNTVEYIAVESDVNDLRDIITDIMYFKDKKEFMDLRLWN